MAVFVLSLIGVPPTAGFFGKLLIIDALVAGGASWLAILHGAGGRGFGVLLPANRCQYVYAQRRPRCCPRLLSRFGGRGRGNGRAMATVVVGIWSSWLLELSASGTVQALL